MKNRIHNHNTYKHLRQDLRNDATKSERTLWKHIRNSQLGGYKFRRQHGIGSYIVDFYCSTLKLIVELDGWVHGEEEQKRVDAVRQAFLENQGFFVIRYRNEQIRYDMKSVLHDLYMKCKWRDSEIKHP